MRKSFIVALVTCALASVLAACGITDEYATSTSDTHVCVYDGSERGGQKLKFQIPPGAESKKIDSNDQVVRIPSSNRFWMVSEDRNVADPGTPNFYTGNAAGGVPVFVTGQIRFRFNLELACEWYSQHGRRNAGPEGDLGFNVRGNADAGWFLFLNQYFTQTMQEVISEEMYAYDWAALHYNYPINADEAGVVPDGTEAGESTRQVLGEELGATFTERLTANLGAPYFCGIEISPTAEEPCPGMTLQVTYAGPNRGASAGAEGTSSLVQERQQVEDTRTRLEAQRLNAELESSQREETLAAERARQERLALEAETAKLEAQINTAECQILAERGLDCDGKHAPVIANGQQVGG